MTGFRKVCLVGFDRIVGSFALGLKRSGFKGSMVGVADTATISKCWKLGLIHDGFQDLTKALPGADLIMLASQSAGENTQLKDVLDWADDGSTISEMTRVKGNVNAVFESRHRDSVHYVGFRLLGDVPDEGDVDESNRFFFEDKTVILTPRGKDDLESFSSLQDLMRKMGSTVIAMSPQAHDKLLAHLAQVPKTAMVAILQRVFDGDADIKVAPEMLSKFLIDEARGLAALRQRGWVEDLAANQELVLQGIDAVLARLQKIKADIQSGTLGGELDALISRAGVALQLDTATDTADLVLLAGPDMMVLQKTSEVLANARITIESLEKMENAEPGTYRLRMKSPEDRNRAVTLLRQAGMDVENLV